MLDEALKAQMKAEAIKRMKSIRLYNYVIEDFEVDGNIQVYEPPQGAAYWLEEDEEERVAQIENDNDILVWGVIRVFVNDSIDVDYLLYVSNNQDNWPQERKDLTSHNPMVFAIKDESIDSLKHGRINIYMSSGGTPLRKGNSFVEEPIMKKMKENTCPTEYNSEKFDEEALKLAITIVVFYINHGIFRLEEIYQRLSDDLRIRILPYLRGAYVACLSAPNTTKEELESMDDYSVVDGFDVKSRMLELHIKSWLHDNFNLVMHYVDEGYDAICKGFYGEDWNEYMKGQILKDHPEWNVWTELNWRLFFDKLLETHIEPDNRLFLSLHDWMLLKAYNDES